MDGLRADLAVCIKSENEHQTKFSLQLLYQQSTVPFIYKLVIYREAESSAIIFNPYLKFYRYRNSSTRPFLSFSDCIPNYLDILDCRVSSLPLSQVIVYSHSPAFQVLLAIRLNFVRKPRSIKLERSLDNGMTTPTLSNDPSCLTWRFTSSLLGRS